MVVQCPLNALCHRLVPERPAGSVEIDAELAEHVGRAAEVVDERQPGHTHHRGCRLAINIGGFDPLQV